jgi:hypothetical protein
MIRAFLTLAGVASESRLIPLFFGIFLARQNNTLESYRGAYRNITLHSNSYRKITINTD